MFTFHEVQYVRQNRLFAVIWLPAVIMWVLFVQQILLGQTVGNNPAPDWFVILLWLFIGLGLPFVYFAARMVTDIENNTIKIRYTPFTSRTIKTSDIQRAEMIEYRAMKNFGGWGIRWRTDGTRAYTVTGNQGVMLTLRDGKQVLLGSQQANDLLFAIQQAIT